VKSSYGCDRADSIGDDTLSRITSRNICVTVTVLNGDIIFFEHVKKSYGKREEDRKVSVYVNTLLHIYQFVFTSLVTGMSS
jgi:hypothetical protein